MIYYLYLVLAIIAEVIGTLSMKASEQFTRLWPSMTVVAAYLLAFYFLSLTLRVMPVGIVYAIWSGVGIVLTLVFAALIFKQIPDWPAIVGASIIILGVIIINVFSKVSAH
ncbi:MAG: SMR family transporter [Candidatus Aquirickettsiella sp.]